MVITRKVVLRESPVLPCTVVGVDFASADGVFGFDSLMLAEGTTKGTVDWGDGTREEIVSAGRVQHVYAEAGAYEVRLSDDFAALAVTGTSAAMWGAAVVSFASDARKLTELSASALKGTRIREITKWPPKLRLMGTGVLRENGDLERIASLPASVEDMKVGVFAKCPKLKEIGTYPPRIDSLLTMMFQDCAALVGPLRFPNITLVKGTGEAMMPFAGCAALREIHFAAKHEAAIKASPGYAKFPTFGAKNAVVLFDL